MSSKKKVLLGMSGGVDSSTSAILLQKSGYEVVGITLKMWEDKDGKNVENAIEDARKVCEKLDIKHYVEDCTEVFKTRVIGDFIKKYKDAKTPNPCIECNRFLKFGAMFEFAQKMGIDYIATGHYARVEYDEKYKKYVLKKSNSLKKDQSYVLYNIPQEVIEHVIFPLEGFESKDEIRKIAMDNGLEVAQKADSQEICFIPDNDYIRFLKDNLSQEDQKKAFKCGDIVQCDGCVRGKHCGIVNYTVGQRKGLGIQNPTPLFVVKLDKNKNRVIVGDKKDIYSRIAIVDEVNWLLIDNLDEPLKVKAKIRYSAKEADAIIYPMKNEKCISVKVEFDEPQMAITPGQAMVFYIDNIVVGGGKIR